jgi:hypothetical protein
VRDERALQQPRVQAALHLDHLVLVAPGVRTQVDHLGKSVTAVHREAGRVEEVRQLDPALRPGDRAGDRRGADDAAGEGGDRAGVVPEDHRGVLVGALGPDPRPGPDVVRCAEHQVGQRDRVDAEVEQCAAAEHRRAQAVAGWEVAGESEVRLHRGRAADHTVVDHRQHPPYRRIAARPHGLHEEHTGRPGGVDQRRGRGAIERDRLFDQHRAPGPDAGQRRGEVGGVRRGDVDHVEVIVGGERVPGAVRPRRVEPVGERPRARVGP